MVKPEICSPLYKKNKKYTCYNNNHLYQLKNKYNRTHKKKINTNNPVDIWKELDSKLTKCKKESCWAKELDVPVDDVFAPKSPSSWKKNKNEWLSSLEITDVLKQYEKIYPQFKYIGPSPSDYDFKEEDGQCVWPELCNFDVNKTKYMDIGIVFNIDEHEGEGIHWVSMFIDRRKKMIYYFDSAGDKIIKNIKNFVIQVQTQNPSYTFVENHPKEHQFKDSECGMYALFFIITMLKTHNYDYFKGKTTFPDEKIEKLRKNYFNS
jgi:hypothetical protein